MRTVPARTMRTMVVAAVAVVIGLPLAPNTASALSLPWTPPCDGRTATIVSAARIVQGTPGDDVIVATGTSGQEIRGGDGDDIICGSVGPDRILAGAGDDTVLAGNGNDTIDGLTGADTLDGGFGRDAIAGGSGDDDITGGPGNDTIASNTGDDAVVGGGGDDAITGGYGDDTLSGGIGNDAIDGNVGEDLLTGNEGSDTLNGGIGGDSLDGGLAPDVINPGAGSNLCGSDSTDSVLGRCTIDRTGVILSDLVMPAVVTAGETMTITWRAADAGGVSNTNMRFGGYSGWITSWCGFVTVADLVEGDAFDGTYRATCDLPATAVNGSYTVFLSATDTFGNNSAWDSSSQIDFSVTGGSADASPPAVSDLSARVDGDSVVVSWRATDPSGVGAQSAWIAHNVYSFASIEGPYFLYRAAVLVGGDTFDGVYEQRIDRRQIAPDGTYTVWLTVIDSLGNKSFTQTPTTVVL